MRNNILTDAAALNLYSYFDNLIELNGIPLKTTRENPSLTTLSLKEMGFRPSDMFLICSLLKETPWITELDLSRNYFDGSSLICLLDFHLKFLSHLGTINLSYNLLILGSKGKDFSALEYTKTHLMTNKNILNLVLEGMVIPTKLNASILQSLQVNRGIFGSLTPTTFEDFIAKSTLKAMAAKEKKEEKSPLLNWKPKMDIDVAFCVLNKVELCTVECTDNSYTIRPAPPFERSKN